MALLYDHDKNAVLDVQRTINAAHFSPALKVDGVFGMKTQGGVEWLQRQGGSGSPSGHIDDEFLAALGIDPQRKGYVGVDPSVQAPTPPEPPKPPSLALPVLVVAAVSIGAIFGGLLGAGIGAAVGVLGGAVVGRAGKNKP